MGLMERWMTRGGGERTGWDDYLWGLVLLSGASATPVTLPWPVSTRMARGASISG